MPSKQRFSHSVLVRLECINISEASDQEVRSKLHSVANEVVENQIPESTALFRMSFVEVDRRSLGSGPPSPRPKR